MHKNRVKCQHPNWDDDQVQLEQHNKFVGWFRYYINHLWGQMDVPEEIMCLARGPNIGGQGGQGNLLKSQNTKSSILTTSTIHNQLPLNTPSGGQGNLLKSQNTKSTILTTSTIYNQLPLNTPSGGQGNLLKSQNTKSSILTTSTIHNQLPLNTPSGGQGNFLKSQNMKSSILTRSTFHNRLSLNTPLGARHSGVQMDYRGNRENISLSNLMDNKYMWRRGDLVALPLKEVNAQVNKRCCPRNQSSPTNHNRDAICQDHMSDEALETINRAEVVLEFTPTPSSREADREAHLSREVLEAHYEEINESDSNTTETTFPTNTTLRKTRGLTQETTVTPPKGKT
ncbi:hypothetical protein Taro_039588 [Colocasia esculenta]|uniref:Uncharacterized protein n=1 Tax=Colocasia esculenta TaxID=4460 RepID=A0A843WW57_COLES|nr:hypothetical protein [Colocasia esculenta]